MTSPVGESRTFEYASPQGAVLEGDLYLPAGEGPFPLLVAAPGGAWRICRRESWREWGEHCAQRGYAFFGIDYRLATPERSAFPAAVCDVIAAVRFARGMAGKWRVDPGRIGLFGASAGAHLAALAALSHDHPMFDASRDSNAFGEQSASVGCLIAVYGVYDLFSQWQHDVALNPAAGRNDSLNLVGCDPFENQQSYFDASPIRHVGYHNSKVAVLVAWGTEDEYVDPSQSSEFVQVLRQARFNVRTYKAVGASHFWINQPLESPSSDSARFAPRMIQFLQMTL